MAAEEDDFAKLMREVDAVTGSGAATPPATPAPAQQQAPGGEVATTGGRSPRAKWAAIAAIGGGILGFLVGSVLFILPGVDGLSTAIGAALGAGVAAFAGGPPQWLK